MYGANASVAASGLSAVALTSTALDVFWIIISALALIMVAVLLPRLIPKEEF